MRSRNPFTRILVVALPLGLSLVLPFCATPSLLHKFLPAKPIPLPAEDAFDRHFAPVKLIRSDQESERVIIQTADRRVAIYDLRSGKLLNTLRDRTADSVTPAFDRSLLISTGYDSRTRVRRLPGGEDEDGPVATGHEIQISRDAKYFAVHGGRSGWEIYRWSGLQLAETSGSALRFDPRGRRAGLLRSRKFEIYSLPAWKLLATVPLYPSPRSFAWHPDGEHIAVAYEAGIGYYSIADAKLIFTQKFEKTDLLRIAPGGDYLVAMHGHQGRLLIRDLTGGKTEVFQLAGASGSFDFWPGKRALIVGFESGAVHVLDLARLGRMTRQTQAKIEEAKRARSELDDFFNSPEKMVRSLPPQEALMSAIRNRRPDLVRLALKRGASPNPTPDRKFRVFLMEAAERGNLESVRILLDAGARVDAVNGIEETALMTACQYAKSDIARLLIERGADIHKKDEYGSTAIMYAITSRTGAVDVVKILDQAGAKLNVLTKNRSGLLHLASAKNAPAVVSYLLRRDAKVDARNRDGQTPLMNAARRGKIESVRVLLNAGADPRLKNNAGLTAADLVRAKLKEYCPVKRPCSAEYRAAHQAIIDLLESK